jgi:hypothetical protein
MGHIDLNLHTYINDRDAMVSYVETLPSETLPRGLYLVHNSIRPARPLGKHGFRAWAQTNAKVIYDWFKTAVCTPDLKDAQELLGRLQVALQ